VAVASIAGKVEERGVQVPPLRRCTNPIFITGAIAETSAGRVITFEVAIDEDGGAFVTLGPGDFEITLSGVLGGGGVGRQKVLRMEI
jgi:hypothetical protein